MSRALFVVDSPHETSLPPMEELTYPDPETNEIKGGWWVYGEAPRPDTVLICVDTSEAKLDAMQADERYLFVGTLIEPEVTNG